MARNPAARDIRVVIGISLGLYLLAFFLPAGNTMNGFTAFLSAALSMLAFVPVWLANPLYWAACWWLWRGRAIPSLVAGLTAVLAALTLPVTLPAGGAYGVSLHVGFFVWLAAPLIVGFAALLLAIRQRHSPATASPKSGESPVVDSEVIDSEVVESEAGVPKSVGSEVGAPELTEV